MKAGLYNIADIQSGKMFFEDSLTVNMEKSAKLIEIILTVVFSVFLLVVSIKKRFYPLLVVLIFFFINIGYAIKEYVNTFKKNPYLYIDGNGITFENKRYPWTCILDIKYERYLGAANWGEKLYIVVEGNKEIIIMLGPSIFNVGIEEIAGFINKYWKA